MIALQNLSSYIQIWPGPCCNKLSIDGNFVINDNFHGMTDTQLQLKSLKKAFHTLMFGSATLDAEPYKL